MKPQLSPVSIVHIDDDPYITSLVKKRLTRHFSGCEIESFHVASAGFDRLRDAEKERIDLVICDLGLPDMSGYELVANIRSDAKTKTIPIVVLSSRTGLQDYARADEVGADSFVEKPLARNTLEKTVETLITKFRQVNPSPKPSPTAP